jgi:hypothetical protein
VPSRAPSTAPNNVAVSSASPTRPPGLPLLVQRGAARYDSDSCGSGGASLLENFFSNSSLSRYSFFDGRVQMDNEGVYDIVRPTNLKGGSYKWSLYFSNSTHAYEAYGFEVDGNCVVDSDDLFVHESISNSDVAENLTTQVTERIDELDRHFKTFRRLKIKFAVRSGILYQFPFVGCQKEMRYLVLNTLSTSNTTGGFVFVSAAEHFSTQHHLWLLATAVVVFMLYV